MIDDNINYRGYTIEIDQDEFPESPREWDNLGTMICKQKPSQTRALPWWRSG